MTAKSVGEFSRYLGWMLGLLVLLTANGRRSTDEDQTSEADGGHGVLSCKTDWVTAALGVDERDGSKQISGLRLSIHDPLN
jgi:hypothetical protein